MAGGQGTMTSSSKAVLTYKILNNLRPGSLHGKFTIKFQISAYETGNCPYISIPKQSLEFFKSSFHYSAATLWNEVPSPNKE